MKKVLVVGHFWPYHPGGSKRVLGLAKYLCEFGWEPVVVSGKLHSKPERNFNIIETECPHAVADLKKKLRLNPALGLQEQFGIPPSVIHGNGSLTTRLVKMVEELCTYPEIESGWLPFALKAIEEQIDPGQINAMISVWPITAHLISYKLKRKYRWPWLADFPDLWANSYGYRYTPVRKWFDTKLEKKTLKAANILTTSSWPQTDVLKKLHNRRDAHTITIGFDSDRINDPPAPLTGKFTITYTGKFYGNDRNPSKFFTALSELVSEELIDPDLVDVRFYGPKDPGMDYSTGELKLAHLVRQYGLVSWDECLKRQRESQLLLQLNWENADQKGAYSGKITEYLAARRPVLSVGGFGNDVIEELFRNTRCGSYCTGVQETREALLGYYAEYTKSGKVSFQGDIKSIDNYSYRKMAGNFADLLNTIV